MNHSRSNALYVVNTYSSSNHFLKSKDLKLYEIRSISWNWTCWDLRSALKNCVKENIHSGKHCVCVCVTLCVTWQSYLNMFCLLISAGAFQRCSCYCNRRRSREWSSGNSTSHTMHWYSRALPHRFEIFGRPVCGAPRCPRSERRDLDRAERFEDVRNVDGGVGALLLQLDHQGLRLCVGLRGTTGRRILNPWGGWKLKPCQNIRILPWGARSRLYQEQFVQLDPLLATFSFGIYTEEKISARLCVRVDGGLLRCGAGTCAGCPWIRIFQNISVQSSNHWRKFHEMPDGWSLLPNTASKIRVSILKRLLFWYENKHVALTRMSYKNQAAIVHVTLFFLGCTFSKRNTSPPFKRNTCVVPW